MDGLLLSLNLFESKELFSILLVEFGDDESDCVVNARNNDMLNGVHSTVCNLDDFVQNNKSSLPESQSKLQSAFKVFKEKLT